MRTQFGSLADMMSRWTGAAVMYHTIYEDVSWERMERAVEKVRQRLLRAAVGLGSGRHSLCRRGRKCRGGLGFARRRGGSAQHPGR